jgi:hypothetical protein
MRPATRPPPCSGWVESLRPALGRAEASAPPPERPAWRLWTRWVSEVVADFWSVGKLGIASTLGLLGVVSLPDPSSSGSRSTTHTRSPGFGSTSAAPSATRSTRTGSGATWPG